MRVPVSWLKELVEITVEPSALADRLTFAGLEIEAVEKHGGDFTGIVAGEIVSVERHPNADRLTLCGVNTGAAVVRVVCGAPNVKVGDKAPFAAVGAVLPSGLKIKPAKIRGEPSEGMLCAEDELGISADHSGLMGLPSETVSGTPLSEILGPPDTVLVIEVTPNRPDCLSLIGIAREVAALYGTPLRLPVIELKDSGPAVETRTSVIVEDTAACPRYTARLIESVTVKPSPFWMRRRLMLCGVRPINNIVDITNYVMLECGQPLHAFDQSLLKEGRIVVRRAQEGESMATLDGVSRSLTPDILVIADAIRPVAIAGIMGGVDSGILDSTRTVLLESACFNPSLVRRDSKMLGLTSESSHRFERGVDIQLADWASRRAAALMAELSDGMVARGVIDRFPAPPLERQIVCRFARVRSVLGVAVSDDQIIRFFESIALRVVGRTDLGCTLQVPTFRPDLEQEADLIEEIARLYGLDAIPKPTPVSRIVPGASDAAIRAAWSCKERLAALGLNEIMNYSFVSDKLLSLFNPEGAVRRVVLPRPISADHSVLRDSLIPQMVETLGRNRSRQRETAAFFEAGRVFFKRADGTLGEEDRVAVGVMGPAGRGGLDLRKTLREEDVFFWVKGILESLCRSLSIPVRDRPGDSAVSGLAFSAGPGAEACDFPLAAFKSGRVVSVALDGERVGLLGLVNDAIRREWRLLDPVAVCEVRQAALLKQVASVPVAPALPVYPSIARDLALKAPKTLKHQDVVKAIWQGAPKTLTRVDLFDIYTGNEMGSGVKSMAYSLTYRSLERTLTDDEANAYHEAVKAALRQQLQVEIRES